MVKDLKKVRVLQSNTINSVLTDNRHQPKSRQQIYQTNYQKNKERKKQQRKERYQQDKEREKDYQKERYDRKKGQVELAIQQQFAKYYGAEAFKILMSFKEYTELSREKKKLWQKFNWTLKDCQEAIKEGLGDITAIMKLEQVANELVRDYWATAKSEEKQKGKSWNNLDYDQQQRLIKCWGYEKARIENNFIDTAEKLEREGKQYEKEIELAKYHEERGKIKCECYACEEQKKIRAEVEAEREKILDDYEAEQKKGGEGEVKKIRDDCAGCYEYKKVDPDSGLCKKCQGELRE